MSFVSTPHLRLHYREAGTDGRVVLFVHGHGGSGRQWELVLPHLQSVRAVVPDLRGCGESDKPDVDYTIEQSAADMRHLMWELDLARFALVGHGLGAAVALDFTLRWPHRVAGLVLLGSSPGSGEPLQGEEIPLLEQVSRDRKLMDQRLRLQAPGAPRDHFWDQVVDDAMQGAEALVPYARSLGQWNVMEQLGELRTPALFIHGAGDAQVPVARIGPTVAAVPGSRLEVLADCGHMPHLEQPAVAARAMHEFLSALG